MTRRTAYAEQALSANNEEFTPEALEAAGQNSFSRILTRFGQQASVQRNEDTPTPADVDEDGQPVLYVSDTGFTELFSDAAKMTTLYGNEQARGRPRPAEVLDQRQVDQVVLRSFGREIDYAALAAGARSIQVDPNTGHNPYKVYAHLQRQLQGARPVTTHVISRRGDIYTLLPWSRAPSAAVSRRNAERQVEMRAISIDLESWYTTYNTPFRGADDDTFRIVGLMPYTAEQMSALAFLVKKLGLWSTTDPFQMLGFTAREVSSKLGSGAEHAPGIVLASTYLGDSGPGGEFELPAGFTLGDALPAHLAGQQAAWEERFEKVYRARGYSAGTPLAAIDALKGVAASVRALSFETDLFTTVTEPVVFEAAPPTTDLAAANELVLATAGSGFTRAQTMQSTPRSRLYEAASIAQDAVTIAAAELEARQAQGRDGQIRVPAVQSAVCFDFSTGTWGYQQVQIIPDPSGVHVEPPPGTSMGHREPAGARPTGTSTPAGSGTTPARGTPRTPSPNP